jgi:PAS fold
MIGPSQDWFPPHAFWDLVLRAAPSHLFVFDTALICRYAAPSGEEFLGIPRDDLLGRHAAEFLPPASDGLRPLLEQAVFEGKEASLPQYRYAHRVGDAETLHLWSVRATPLHLDSYRSVLLALSDIVNLVEQRDQLQFRCDDLQGEVERLRRAQAEGNRGLGALVIQLRSRLTPVLGYAQLLVRRPELLGSRAPEAILRDEMLPQLHLVVEIVQSLEHLQNAAATDQH